MRPTHHHPVAQALLICMLLALPMRLHAQPDGVAQGVAQDPGAYPATYPGDAVVFLSSTVLDRILSAADGSEYRLSDGVQMSVRLLRIRTAFVQGPGEFSADLEATLPGRDEPLALTASGMLEVIADNDAAGQQEHSEQRHGRLQLRPQLTRLLPKLAGSTFEDTLRLVAAATIKGALNGLARVMPAFNLPLSRALSLDQPAAQHDIRFRLGGANIDGQLQVPPMRLTLSVAARQLVFTQRGLFALLNLEPAGIPIAPAASREPPDPGLLDTLLPRHEAIGVLIKGRTLARLVQAINTLPPASRTLQFHSARTRGKLAQRSRLGLGCGSDARLAGPAALRSGFLLGQAQASWRDGRLDYALGLWLDLQAAVRIRINGFPAPCSLTSPRPRCRCARGKTAFTTPVRLHEGAALAGNLVFSRKPAGGAQYHAALTAPARLRVSPRVQLGRLGSFKVPLTIPMPIGTLGRGPLPSVFERQGTVALGYPAQRERRWQLELRNTRLHTDAIGLSAGFAFQLLFADQRAEAEDVHPAGPLVTPSSPAAPQTPPPPAAQ